MKFVVAIHHPVGYDGSGETEERTKNIDDLNKEMVEAGVRYVVGGLGPSQNARSLRTKNGEILVTDGPYLETKEIIGGFWILDVADLDEAIMWAKKAVVACGTPVEIRDFYGSRSEHPNHQGR